jgi:hypothetical protein
VPQTPKKTPTKKAPAVTVETLDARPEFDLFTYSEICGETRIEHDLLEELEPRFDDWADNRLNARILTEGDQGYVLIWLDKEVEDEIEGIWQDSQSAGMAFHNLAIHMVMSAVQGIVPELAERGCAPLPAPSKAVQKAFTKLGLAWNKEGTVNRQFAVFSNYPAKPGCGGCMLRPKCPNAEQ